MIISSRALSLVPAIVARPNAPVIGWRSVVTGSGVAAGTEADGYPASNLATPSTAERWQGADASDQDLTFTVGGDEPVDYVGLARHNFGSAAVAVRIEGEDPDESGSWSELVEEFMPADDGPILARFPGGIYSRIRVRLRPTAVAPRLAVAFIGRLLVLERNIYVGHTPIPFGRGARITNARSESGDYLGRIVLTETLDTSVDLQNLTPAWYRTHLDPFIRAAKEAPFFWAWRPQSYPGEVGYAWLTNDPRPTNQRSNGMMQVSLQMGGVAL